MANTEFDSRDSQQAADYSANGKYTQSGLVKIGSEAYCTDVYGGPNGVGYIHRAFRLNGDNLEMMVRHTGPESRVLPAEDTWVVVTETDADGNYVPHPARAFLEA